MDSPEIDPEMAAFMGFSSFGTQPAAKKRKYNHRIDAVSSATTDSATGANQIALASRAVPTAATASGPKATAGANADEIDLDVDVDSDADNDNLNAAAAADAGADDDDGDGSKQADNDEEEGGASLYSDPTRAPALAHAQGLIDEMTTRGGVGSGSGEFEAGDEASRAQGSRSLPTTLPKRPDASWGTGDMGSAPTRNRGETLSAGASGGRGSGSSGGRYQHQHQRANDGKPWWEGYYDPKSNENPWEKLEKAAGVASRATWSAGTISSLQTA